MLRESQEESWRAGQVVHSHRSSFDDDDDDDEPGTGCSLQDRRRKIEYWTNSCTIPIAPLAMLLER